MAHNKTIFKKLIGQKLEKIYWVSEKATGKWLKNFPVVLKLEDGFLTLCADKYSDFSISWSDTAFDTGIDFKNSKESLIQWEEYKTRYVENVKDQKIEAVEIINFLPRFLSVYNVSNKKEDRILKHLGFLHGVGFCFRDFTMVVVNGLDDNNIVFFDKAYPDYYTRIIISAGAEN